MADRSLVRNAADRKQVDRASKLEKQHRENELADLRAVLELPAGRRLLWRLLGKYKWGQSTFDLEATQMAFNTGMQNAGNYLMAEITEADAGKLLTMMQESQARENLENAVTDALQNEGAAVTQDTQENPDADS